MNIRILAPLTLLSFALVAAGPATSEDPVLLAFKFKAGEKMTSVTTVENKMSLSGALSMDMNQGITTTTVTEFEDALDGWFKFTTKTSDVKVTSDADLGVSPDEAADLAKKVTVSGLVKADGSQKDYKVDGPAEVTGMMVAESGALMGFVGLSFPSQPINTGFSWTNKVDVPASDGGMASVTGGTMTSTYTLKSTELKDGKMIATIAFAVASDIKIETQAGPGTVNSNTSGNVFFNLTDGRVVSIEQSGTTTSDIGVVTVKAVAKSKSVFETASK